MAEPKVRFKKNDGSSYPAWAKQTVGEMTVELTDYKPLGCGLPLLTSSRTGLMFQDEYRGKTSTDNEDTLFSVVPRGAVTYRHMSDDDIFHFNINDLVDAGLVSKEYPVFNTVNGNNIRLLVEYLNSSNKFLEFCKAQKKGGTRTRLYFKVLKDFEIMFPCVEEQQKIADFLSSVDEVITTSEQEVANLETQKKAVMKKIFSQEVRFKRADGTDFPEWEERDLVELFPYIRNGFVGTITDFFTEKENGIRYLQGTNIHDGIISDNVEFYVTREFHQKHINNELKEDDIIMVQSGHVGDCAVVGKKYAGSNCHALIIMSNAGNCCSDFYVDYFHSPDGLREISIKATGNTVKHILASVMQSFRVPYPSLEEQRLIADFLSDFDEAIAAAKKELELWKELKKGLLQQMFV